ncbi:hypothetical protein QUB47_34370 [Microcoleus sp. AT9_B5]
MDKKLMIYSFAGLVAAGAIAASGLTNSKVQNQGSQMPPMQQGEASMGGMQHGEKSNNPDRGHSIATQAKLTASRDIAPKTPVKLSIDVQDSVYDQFSSARKIQAVGSV